MDYYRRRNTKSYPTHNPMWPDLQGSGGGGQGNAEEGEIMECGSEAYYLERGGEKNCIYYMRTGVCPYGDNCRYNHPKNPSFVGVVAIGRGEYPERVGVQECKFYLKTGTCYFGMNCIFHHPRNLLIDVPLNVYGYPLRLGEKECSYYMENGVCKFGMACIFHHPQPDGISIAPVGYLVQSPSNPLSGVYHKLSRPPPYVNPYYALSANGTAAVSFVNWNGWQGAIMGMNGALALPQPVASYGPYLKPEKLSERMYGFLSPGLATSSGYTMYMY